MPEIKTAGIVLHRRDFGEADRIVKIFTREFGLVGALARGVKKVKSRRAGAFELFSESEFRLARRSGELFTVADAAVKKSFPAELPRLGSAYAAGEWLLTLLPLERPFPKIFEFTLATLATLATTEKLRAVELAFRFKILKRLGFLPEFENFDERARKLVRFFLEAKIEDAPRIELDEKIFGEVECAIEKVFEEVAEKPSRATRVVADWK